MSIKSKNETSVKNKSKTMTKYNIRLVKSIYTPVEIEAENMHEALKKASGKYGRVDDAVKFIDPRKE